MRIGISVQSAYRVEDPAQGVRYMLERAEAASQADLDCLFVGDHHVTDYAYYQNSPILGRMLAHWPGTACRTDLHIGRHHARSLHHAVWSRRLARPKRWHGHRHEPARRYVRRFVSHHAAALGG